MKKVVSMLVSFILFLCMFPISALGATETALSNKGEMLSDTFRATIVKPTVTLSSISSKAVGSTVVVSGSSSLPCYRMAASYTVNGTTHWLPAAYSNSYSKSFTASEVGTYTVTLHARSYPETDSRSGASSKSVSFTVYQKKVTPTVTISSISNKIVGNTITVSGSSSTPCYRMAASYTVNGTTHWLPAVYSNSYSKSFTATESGTYKVSLFSRSYPETDARSDDASKSVSFTVYQSKVTPTVTISSIPNKMVGDTVTVSGSSSTPCYRMAASYTVNGTTHWLPAVNSNSYSKSFVATEPGTYVVSLQARSYPETDPRSVNAGKTVSFSVSSPPSQKVKQDSVNEEYFMSVSENGLLNHFTIKATYTEKYTPSGNNSIFNNRSVWYEIKENTEGTADFVYSSRLPDHVSDWRNPPNGSIFDGGYDYYGEKISTTSISYPKSTTASGTLYLSITSSPPAINPYSKQLRISFNTNS